MQAKNLWTWVSIILALHDQVLIASDAVQHILDVQDCNLLVDWQHLSGERVTWAIDYISQVYNVPVPASLFSMLAHTWSIRECEYPRKCDQ